MNTRTVPPSERRRIARTAVDSLGGQRSDHALVRVTCPASHHVATVYRTEEGPAVVSGGPHTHGSRDFVDTAHHGDNLGSEFVDLLEASEFEDDALPVRCACGSRTLSRQELQQAVRSHTHTLLLP
ncbi:hypothetical protein [Rhodococcus sp. NPDC058514]|uniref:hypothetical protein n=1 Tax=unclassified Rhodococcus (in: high G+C Gram-positive bacteria) TaxID=192944 RepID=UPI0036500B4F